MADLLAKNKSKIYRLNPGQKVSAKVTEITKKLVVFDIGGKAEGVLKDATFQEARDYIKTLKLGDTVEATIVIPETSDGSVLLSLRQTAGEAAWQKLSEAKAKDLSVRVLVKSSSEAGVSVEIDGQFGFIPNSQLSRKLEKNIDDVIGKNIEVKVIEVDKEKSKIVLSEKAVSEAGDMEFIRKAIDELKEGEIYKGTVSKIANFGAFVSIPVKVNGHEINLEGLVHVSEISWQKVKDPNEVLTVGEKIEVKSLGLRDGKLALSIKSALTDPWQKVARKYKVEMKIKGRVERITDYGVFVSLEPGIEGLIHITKIPPATNLERGKEVNCYIEEIDSENRKISLGLVLTSKPIGYK